MYEKEIMELANNGQMAEAAIYAETNAINAVLSAALIHSQAGNPRGIRLAKFCIELSPDNPELYANLSYLLGNEMRCEEALEAIETAIELSPEGKFFYTKAMLLASLKRFEDAIPFYRKSIETLPEAHQIKFSLGSALNILGYHREGLPLLESRFLYDKELSKFRQRFDKPDWVGQDLTNKTLLIYNEQGLGDVFQYVRYVPWFRKFENCKIITECPQQLESLLSHFFEEFIGRTPDYDTEQPPNLPHFDYRVAFASIPYLIDPDLNQIPPAPYLHVKKSTDLNLNVNKDKLNIGIIWAGNALYPNDLNRSFSAKYFLPLSKLPNVQLYNLQLGEMKRTYRKSVDLGEGLDQLNAIDVTDKLTDMGQTAEIMNQLDLIITADTSLGHLAGALGKPVWVLISFCHDCRWRLNETTTPWYSSMRVFHQKSIGDWTGVMEEVVQELKISSHSELSVV